MKLTIAELVRYGASAAVAGGLLRVVSAFIPYVPDSPGLELLYGIVDVLLLFGLMGLYAAYAEKTGWTGLAGFVVATIGLAIIVGPDAVAFGVEFYLAGSACLLAGLAVLSIGLLVARRLRLSAGLWLGSLALALIGAWARQPLLLAAAGAVLGLAFMAAGISVNNSSAGPAPARK